MVLQLRYILNVSKNLTHIGEMTVDSVNKN